MVIEWAATPDAIRVERLTLGTRHRFRLAADSESGESKDTPFIPVEVLIGSRHHPCLALVAGVHGDEYDGILALQTLAREVDPRHLAGTLLIIPVANPYAFAAARRLTPEDDVDLNRVFPGAPDGGPSQRLADRLSRGMLQQADLIFTMHGAGERGMLAPWVEFLDVPGPMGRATYTAAHASGFTDLIALPRLPGVLMTAMADLGVPLIEGEVGGRGATTRANVAYYRARAHAVLRHAGLLEIGGPSVEPPVTPRLWHLRPIEAGAQGIFVRDVTLGQDVLAGDRLGTILNIHGDEIADVHAPERGRVGGYLDHAGVEVGARVVTLWLPVAVLHVDV